MSAPQLPAPWLRLAARRDRTCRILVVALVSSPPPGGSDGALGSRNGTRRKAEMSGRSGDEPSGGNDAKIPFIHCRNERPARVGACSMGGVFLLVCGFVPRLARGARPIHA